MLPRSPLFWVCAILLLCGAFATKNASGFTHFAHFIGAIFGLMLSGLFAILGVL